MKQNRRSPGALDLYRVPVNGNKLGQHRTLVGAFATTALRMTLLGATAIAVACLVSPTGHQAISRVAITPPGKAVVTVNSSGDDYFINEAVRAVLHLIFSACLIKRLGEG